MKAFLFVLSAVACVVAAVLSTVRVDPAYACPATNNIFYTIPPSGATPDEQRHFEYDITVDGWQLTFSPSTLGTLTFDLEGSFGVENLSLTPDAQWVAGQGCDNYPDPTPFETTVQGNLKESHDDIGGSVWVNIRLAGNNGNPQYSEVAATGINPMP
jgi:hypothetical protein